MSFTDYDLNKWKYALENVWTIKFDRNEVDALIHRLECAETALQTYATNFHGYDDDSTED